MADSNTDTPSSSDSTQAINKDKIALRLLRVNGEAYTFHFSPNQSVAHIAKHVFDNWPAEWSEETANSYDVLRLIYQGRFLQGNVTLGALKLPVGKVTVMHLVCRESLPEPHTQEQRIREKTGESRCRLCCCIL